jgi:glycosyltransferase involved in cell wall biosynthesis
MNEKIMVSVCCSAYNHEKFIRDAINGFLMQKTNFPFEIIIHDDASTDGTANVIREYENKYPELIKPIYQKENKLSKGLKPLQNFVWPRCSGKYIAMCEGDDYWTDSYKLQKQVDFLETNQEYSLCFHKIKVLLKNGMIVDDFITKIRNDVTTIKDLAMFGNYIHTLSVVLRNDFEIPPWFSNCPIGDYAFYFIAVRKRKIKYLHESMGVYRFGVGVHSSSSSYNIKATTFLTIQEIIENYPDEVIRAILMKRNRKILYNLLICFLLLKEGTPEQFDTFLCRYYRSISNNLSYELAVDFMRNWPLLSMIFIKNFFITRYKILKNTR